MIKKLKRVSLVLCALAAAPLAAAPVDMNALYTVQLAAFSDAAKLSAFVKDKNLVEKDFAKAEIVVDNADGTITEQYQLLGVGGYPSYILLDPEGKIIHNDNVSPPPSLRRYKLERIYEALRGRLP